MASSLVSVIVACFGLLVSAVANFAEKSLGIVRYA